MTTEIAVEAKAKKKDLPDKSQINCTKNKGNGIRLVS
jgi:hypothetical protein